MNKRRIPPAASVSDSGVLLSRLALDRFVALDVETTGLDPNIDRIIEIGAVRFVNGEADETFQSLLRVDGPLDPFITELTGITDDDLQMAPDFKDVAADFRDFLGEDVLAGHNLDFDLSFLRVAGQELRVAGLATAFQFEAARAVDTGMLARIFWPELPSFSLASLTRNFRVTMTQAHRGPSDALATGELLCGMIAELPDRLWSELASALDGLIGTTSHRSRFLFARLAEVCAGRVKPQQLPVPEAESETDWHASPLRDLLDTVGPLAAVLPSFKRRGAQVTMAEAVAHAFEHGQFLLVEAPTGVGKSLAYLLPAICWVNAADDEKRQVIISSNTKVLQEQLFRKDVQDIRRALGDVTPVAVLKGRNNYLCKRRLRKLLREAPERLSEHDRIQLMPLIRWSELTESGDITEINGFSSQRNPHLWSLVASDAQACTGSSCGAAKGDFHRAAVDRAAKASLVFVNHALLATDIPRFTGSGRRLVIDEAHQFERSVIAALTVELSPAVFRNALSRIAEDRSARGFLSGLIERSADQIGSRLQADGERLIADSRAVYGMIRQSFGGLSETLGRRLSDNERAAKLRFQSGSAIQADITEALAPLRLLWDELTAGLREFEADLALLRGEDRLPAETLVELRSAIEVVERCQSAASVIFDSESDNIVSWIEFGRSAHANWCALFAAPVAAGPIMSKLWPAEEGAVLTSATMAMNGVFDAVRQSLGLQEFPAAEHILPSPFNLAERMRIYVPGYLPDPRRSGDDHAMAATALIADVCAKNPRGTLVLCTSNDMAERIAAAVTPVTRKTGRLLLNQRAGGSPAELVAAFRRAGDAVLVGAMSLWEGIDVIGDALQILIVTRLPFDVPTDPWVAARSESVAAAGGDSFTEFSLPVAALRLKQGIGRLIRHPADRGVAIIADPRLVTTRYGRIIRDSLPVPVSRIDSIQDLDNAMTDFFCDLTA